MRHTVKRILLHENHEVRKLVGIGDRRIDLLQHIAFGIDIVLRAVFTAAGGTHDDWDTYDRVMREERRTAVLVPSTRVYSNPA